jgi:xylan 1,4-beta-xylosidase
VPIFRSHNLVDWTQIGNVLDRPAQLDLTRTTSWSSLGVYAPTIRHHEGRFFMITTNVTDAGALNFFVTTTDPAGPWSDPVPVAISGIDPDIAWDRSGNCWVHFSGLGGIARCRIDDITGEVLEGPTSTWAGTGLQYPEAPHLFEREGTWYLVIAEGGTQSGHAVSLARGPGPIGPWEPCPSNPILSHRSLDRPIQNTGHADMIEASDGSWWMVLLGIRAKGISPGFHVLGRETFLVPVEWVDGWPVVGQLQLAMEGRPPGPVEPVDWNTHERFEGAALHPRWIAIRQRPEEIASLSRRSGWLTLAGTEATLDDAQPVLVGRRQQHHRCRFRARVDAKGETEAGLAVRLDETSHYEVAVVGDRVLARARIGPLCSIVGEAPRPGGPLILSLETDRHAHGADVVRLGWEDESGGCVVLAELDGRYLSSEVTGGFIGRVLGMYAVGGEAAFAWAHYEGVE